MGGGRDAGEQISTSETGRLGTSGTHGVSLQDFVEKIYIYIYI